MTLTEQITNQGDEGPQLETKGEGSGQGAPVGNEDTTDTSEGDDDSEDDDAEGDDDGEGVDDEGGGDDGEDVDEADLDDTTDMAEGEEDAEEGEGEEDAEEGEGEEHDEGDDDEVDRDEEDQDGEEDYEEEGEEEDEGGEDEDGDGEEGPAEKEARLRRELAAAEERLGPGHPNVVPHLVALSTHQFEQDQLAEAEALGRRTLAIVEEHEGQGARRTAVCRHYLHVLLSRQKRYDEAELLLRRVIAHYQKTEGQRSFDVAWALHELASLRHQQGQPRRALSLSRRAVRMMSESAAPLAPRTLTLLQMAGLLRVQLREYDQGIRLFRTALSRCARAGEEAADIRVRAEDGLVLALEMLAVQHQEAGRLAAAAAVARELMERGRTSGHLMAAELHQEAGEPVEAQRVLEAGVLLMPQGGKLWELLGDLYSKQGLLGDAARAYERALACPDVEAGRVRFQAGVLSHQRESPLEAIGHFALVQRDNLDPDEAHLLWQARSHRMLLLRQVGRIPEAIALAGEVVAETSAAGPGPHEEETASLVCLGRALLYMYRDRTAARACAVQAFRVAPDALCLGLLREIGSLGLDSKRSRCLRITVNGRRRDLEAEAGRAFTRTYLVVADSLQEGLSFIRALEEGEGAGPVSLREWACLDIPAVGLRGVHSVSDYRDVP